MTQKIDWRALADLVWDNKTMPEACEILGYDWGYVYGEMRCPDFRRLYVDIGIVATVRNDLIDAQSI